MKKVLIGLLFLFKVKNMNVEMWKKISWKLHEKPVSVASTKCVSIFFKGLIQWIYLDLQWIGFCQMLKQRACILSYNKMSYTLEFFI